MIASTVSLWIRIVPPSPMILSRRPCRARKPASVTTKDGMPTRATSTPITSPITAPVARQASTPRYHGWSCLVETTPSTAPATPAV